MAVPQLADNMPNYVIYRDVQPGEPFDPTSSLLFFPPKGSDELFDALRTSFPHLKSHSERMREAVIHFLHLEQVEQQSLETSPAMPMDSTWPALSNSCSQSVWSSPDSNNLSTPASFAPSPRSQGIQLTRQTSTMTNSSQPSPPAIDQMTSVFSLSTSAQPKQRIRRKMTEAEKIEYRKRRIVKACDKCAKRKRKCPHNQAEMETLHPGTSKCGAKVSKSSMLKSSKSPSPTQQQAVFDPEIFSAGDSGFADSFNFDDFALYQDPLADIDMDDYLQYDQFDPTNGYQMVDLFTPDVSPLQQAWHSSASQDSTRDQSLSDQALFDQVDQRTQYSISPWLSENSGSTSRHASLMQDQASSVNMQQIDSMYSSIESLSSASCDQTLHSSFEIFEESAKATSATARDAHPFHQQQRGDADLPEISQESYALTAAADGLSLPGASKARSIANRRRRGVTAENGKQQALERANMILPEKPVPTHTAHVHDAECSSMSGLNEGIPILQTSQNYSLQRAVLTLTGTKKAIAAFAGLLDSQRRPAVSVTMDHVSQALKECFEWQSRESASAGSSISTQYPSTNAGLLPNVEMRYSDIPRSSRQWQDNVLRSDMGLFENATKLTSTSVSAPGSQRPAAIQGRPRSSDEHKTIQHAIRIHAAPSQQALQTLGEGLPESADPSAQLYMARKRVSSSLTTAMSYKASAQPAKAVAAPTNARLQTIGERASSIVLSASLLQQPQVTANGGAYPRLEARQPAPSTSLAVKPAHTRSRKPDVSGPSGITDMRQDVAPDGMAGVAVGNHACYPNSDEGQDIHATRPRDTNRHKDHHGRAAGLSSYLLVVFGFALLLQAAYPLANMLSSTALLLALVTPYQEAPQRSSLDKIVRCTTKNSRWLSSAFGSLMETKCELASPAREQLGWHHPGTKGTWLKGLMYPFAFAPMQFACCSM